MVRLERFSRHGDGGQVGLIVLGAPNFTGAVLVVNDPVGANVGIVVTSLGLYGESRCGQHGLLRDIVWGARDGQGRLSDMGKLSCGHKLGLTPVRLELTALVLDAYGVLAHWLQKALRHVNGAQVGLVVFALPHYDIVGVADYPSGANVGVLVAYGTLDLESRGIEVRVFRRVVAVALDADTWGLYVGEARRGGKRGAAPV